MANAKCGNCGLVNWPYALECQRCGSPLPREAPPVWKWYVAYCALMAILYLFVTVLGFVFLFIKPSELNARDPDPKIMGVVFIIIGLMLLIPFAAAPFLPRLPWAWVFGLVLICLGLTSVCCLPAAIPLLIFWLKPESKAYFGRM